MYWALTVCTNWNRWGRFMGVVLACLVRVRICILYYRTCCMTLGKVQGILGPMYSWVGEATCQNQRKDRDRLYITIVFVSILVGFIIDITALSWLKLPGRLPGSGHFPFEQLKQLHGRLPRSGRLPGTLRYCICHFVVFDWVKLKLNLFLCWVTRNTVTHTQVHYFQFLNNGLSPVVS